MRRATMTTAIAAALACATWTVAWAGGGGTGRYTWQISYSNVDPNVQTGADFGGFGSIYLWFTGCGVFGAGGAEFELVPDGTWSVLAFNPEAGILNAVSPPILALGLGGCRINQTLIGTILVGGTSGSMRLLKSTGNDIAVTVDCQTPVPVAWDWPEFVRQQGAYSAGYVGTSQDWGNGCDVNAVEATTWGSMKALYR